MKEEINCFQQIDTLLKVAILPLYSMQPIQAVKQQLNNMLFKYHEELEGIPISFTDLQFPKDKQYARIMTDQYWLHIDVLTKCIIFKPMVGKKLSGKISKMTDNHVSILILSLFNASINLDEMSKHYEYNILNKTWQSNFLELKEGDTIEFTMKSYQHANGVIHIDGKLIS